MCNLCMNVASASVLKQNDANPQALLYKSLENELSNVGSMLTIKILLDFLHFAEVLAQNV